MKSEDRRFSWEFAVTGWRRSGGLGGKQGPERDFIYFFSFDTEVEKEYTHSSDEDKREEKQALTGEDRARRMKE